MESKFIKIGGLDIEYYDSETPSDKTLFFAHGLGGSLLQWQEQIKYYKNQYRVIAISFQGHGASQKSSEKEDYKISRYGQIAMGLLKHLHISSCIWIGNSMGGVIGYEVLKTKPDLICKLITNGTTPVLEMSSFSRSILIFFDRLLIKVMGFKGYISFAAKHSSQEKSACDLIYQSMKHACKAAIVNSHYYLGFYTYEETMNTYASRIYILRTSLDKGINGYLKKIDLSRTHMTDIPGAGHIFNLEDPQRYHLYLDEIINDEIV